MKKYYAVLLLLMQSSMQSSEKNSAKALNPFSPHSSPKPSPRSSPESSFIQRSNSPECREFLQEFVNHPSWLPEKIRKSTLKPIVLPDHTTSFSTNIAYTTTAIPFLFIVATENTPCQKYIVLVYDKTIPRIKNTKAYEFNTVLTALVWITEKIKTYEMANQNDDGCGCTIS